MRSYIPTSANSSAPVESPHAPSPLETSAGPLISLSRSDRAAYYREVARLGAQVAPRPRSRAPVRGRSPRRETREPAPRPRRARVGHRLRPRSTCRRPGGHAHRWSSWHPEVHESGTGRGRPAPARSPHRRVLARSHDLRTRDRPPGVPRGGTRSAPPADSSRRPAAPHLVDSSFPTDLETVLFKAMQKEPATATRPRANWPTTSTGSSQVSGCSRRPSVWDRAKRWAGAHPATIATAVVSLFVIVIASGVATAPCRG